MKAIFSNSSPFVQLIFTAFVAVASFLIVFFLGVLIGLAAFGIPLSDFTAALDFTKPEYLSFGKYIQVLQSIALFVVTPIIAAYLFSGNVRSYLHLNQKPMQSSLLAVLFAAFFAIPIVNSLAELNSHFHLPASLKGFEDALRAMEESAMELTQKFLEIETPAGFLFTIFMVAVIPAIGEELMFRGLLQKLFSKWTKNVHLGIWITAAVFSAIHFQFWGFLPRLVLGAFFGYLLLWSGSIWLPVLAHFVNNASIVTLNYIAQKSNYISNQDIDTVGTSSNNLYFLFFSIAIFTLLIYWVYHTEKRRKEIRKQNANEHINQ